MCSLVPGQVTREVVPAGSTRTMTMMRTDLIVSARNNERGRNEGIKGGRVGDGGGSVVWFMGFAFIEYIIRSYTP